MHKQHILLTSLLLVLTACASNTTDTSSRSDNYGSNNSSATDSNVAEHSDVTSVDISDSDSDTGSRSMTDSSIPTAATIYYFAFDRSVLTDEAKTALKAHAAYLQSSGKNAIIEGHADERGSREYNIALGEQRAKSVKNYLTAQGVNSSQLETVSYGEEKPISRANTELAWSINRRAVLDYQ